MLVPIILHRHRDDVVTGLQTMPHIEGLNFPPVIATGDGVAVDRGW